MGTKKLLFIGPEFFSYEKIISSKISDLGYQVTYFSDRPKLGTFGKSVLRVKPSLLKNKIKKYWECIIEKAKEEKFDIVFVIFGQSFTSKMFADLKKTLPNAKFVYYLWDSVDNFPICKQIAKVFDVTYSFDPDDCKKYGYKFLPLFFVKADNNKFDTRKYDYSLITTIKKGKYKLVNEIEKILEPKMNNNYNYCFLQSKKVYLYYKIFTDEIKGAKKDEFAYKRMSYDEYLNILANSKIVVDVPMSKQKGLTMRTFEALASGCKIITTNSDIKNYPFYDEKYILVFDGSNIDFDSEFFNDKAFKIHESFIEKYNIDTWIKTLLS